MGATDPLHHTFHQEARLFAGGPPAISSVAEEVGKPVASDLAGGRQREPLDAHPGLGTLGRGERGPGEGVEPARRVQGLGNPRRAQRQPDQGAGRDRHGVGGPADQPPGRAGEAQGDVDREKPAVTADEVTTAGLGSTRYSTPEITTVATQPRPYSPMTLLFASGPVNQSEVVNIRPAIRPIAQEATAAGEKPPVYQ